MLVGPYFTKFKQNITFFSSFILPSPYVSLIMLVMRPTKRWCLKFIMWSWDCMCWNLNNSNTSKYSSYCRLHTPQYLCFLPGLGSNSLIYLNVYHYFLLHGIFLDLSFMLLSMSFHMILVVVLAINLHNTLSNSSMNPGRHERLSLFKMGTMLWQPNLNIM